MCVGVYVCVAGQVTNERDKLLREDERHLIEIQQNTIRAQSDLIKHFRDTLRKRDSESQCNPLPTR